MTDKKIRAILFDVGGPLVDDSGIDIFWNDYLFHRLPELIGRKVTWEEIEEANRKSIESYTPSLYSATIWHFVQPDKDKFRLLRNEFDRLDFPGFYKVRPEAEPVCRELAGKYTLAIAANQPAATGAFLEKHCILQHFTFKEMSEDIQYFKPDLRFFLYICSRLDIPPDECLMFGDRQDNDIVPARKLRMKTIRMITGTHRDQKVRMPSEMPDRVIFSLSELPSAINDLQS